MISKNNPKLFFSVSSRTKGKVTRKNKNVKESIENEPNEVEEEYSNLKKNVFSRKTNQILENMNKIRVV